MDIRLDAFAFTKYGSIIGKVAYIDPNSFSNEKGQLFYRIKAEMVENNIRVDGAIAPTSVGQSVSVNILVGKRTIMEYLLSPIFTGFRKSIR